MYIQIIDFLLHVSKSQRHCNPINIDMPFAETICKVFLQNIVQSSIFGHFIHIDSRIFKLSDFDYDTRIKS